MTASGRRWIAAGAGALLLTAAAAAGLTLRGGSDELAARPKGERPQLLLLTSLPIAFPEQFMLDAEPPPALAALESRYELVPISTTDRKSLDGQRMLLMAQPNAQPAEMLVELDRWVREGGRVLLLADPALEWESELALNDAARPPRAFPDTGLLRHWGLRLDSPSSRGPESFTVGKHQVGAQSPGSLTAMAPDCTTSSNGFIARCRIGRGLATIVADADFANARPGVAANGSENLRFLLAQLATLER